MSVGQRLDPVLPAQAGGLNVQEIRGWPGGSSGLPPARWSAVVPPPPIDTQGRATDERPADNGNRRDGVPLIPLRFDAHDQLLPRLVGPVFHFAEMPPHTDPGRCEGLRI